MQTFGTYTGGRDNNFNLLRFTAALMVIVSHSFVLCTGNAHDEPWHTRLGITPGSLAVDMFFIASGYLVTASIWHRGSVPQFVWARVLRIYPGLAVAVISTTLVFGIFFSTFSFSEFLAQRDTWRYVVRNIALVIPGGLTWKLPGVFEDHVSGTAINGSLWTLPEEVRMYALLAATWFTIGLLRGSQRRLMGIVALAIVAAGFTWHFATRGDETLTATPRLMALFFTGAVFYIWRERIPATWPIFGSMLAATLLASIDRSVFSIVWLFTLPYLVLFFALVPAGPIRQFNRIGDYSYGLYIYAFPVQKIVIALLPAIGPWTVTAIATPITLVLAIASWYLIEHPALRLKDRTWTRVMPFQRA